jgi:hypothetical protein
MKLHRLMALIALASGCGLFDGSKPCLDTGCSSTYPESLEIELIPPFYEWAAGTYTFAVSLDGEVVTCTVTQGLEDERSCSSDLVYLMRAGSSTASVMLFLQVNTVPDSLGLQVSRDGEEVAAETYSLDIDESAYPEPDPNDSCAQTCPDVVRLEFILDR